MSGASSSRDIRRVDIDYSLSQHRHHSLRQKLEDLRRQYGIDNETWCQNLTVLDHQGTVIDLSAIVISELFPVRITFQAPAVINSPGTSEAVIAQAETSTASPVGRALAPQLSDIHRIRVMLVEYRRSPEEFRHCFLNEPQLHICQQNLEAAGHSTELQSGAKMFLEPEHVPRTLAHLRAPGVTLMPGASHVFLHDLRARHVIVGEMYYDAVIRAVNALRRSLNCKRMRQGEMHVEAQVIDLISEDEPHATSPAPTEPDSESEEGTQWSPQLEPAEPRSSFAEVNVSHNVAAGRGAITSSVPPHDSPAAAGDRVLQMKGTGKGSVGRQLRKDLGQIGEHLPELIVQFGFFDMRMPPSSLWSASDGQKTCSTTQLRAGDNPRREGSGVLGRGQLRRRTTEGEEQPGAEPQSNGTQNLSQSLPSDIASLSQHLATEMPGSESQSTAYESLSLARRLDINSQDSATRYEFT